MTLLQGLFIFYRKIRLARPSKYLLCIVAVFITLNTQAQSWVSVGPNIDTGGASFYATMAIGSNDTPYVSFVDDYNAAGYISVMKYNGSSWVYVGKPGFSDSMTFGGPSIAIDRNGTPYVAFSEEYSGKITVMKHDDTGWAFVGEPRFSDTVAWFISLVIDTTGTPYVAYQDGGGEAPLP